MGKEFSFDVFSDGSLVLSLGEACIQTAARQAHRELTVALLEGRPMAVERRHEQR